MVIAKVVHTYKHRKHSCERRKSFPSPAGGRRTTMCRDFRTGDSGKISHISSSGNSVSSSTRTSSPSLSDSNASLSWISLSTLIVLSSFRCLFRSISTLQGMISLTPTYQHQQRTFQRSRYLAPIPSKSPSLLGSSMIAFFKASTVSDLAILREKMRCGSSPRTQQLRLSISDVSFEASLWLKPSACCTATDPMVLVNFDDDERPTPLAIHLIRIPRVSTGFMD